MPSRQPFAASTSRRPRPGRLSFSIWASISLLASAPHRRGARISGTSSLASPLSVPKARQHPYGERAARDGTAGGRRAGRRTRARMGRDPRPPPRSAARRPGPRDFLGSPRRQAEARSLRARSVVALLRGRGRRADECDRESAHEGCGPLRTGRVIGSTRTRSSAAGRAHEHSRGGAITSCGRDWRLSRRHSDCEVRDPLVAEAIALSGRRWLLLAGTSGLAAPCGGPYAADQWSRSPVRLTGRAYLPGPFGWNLGREVRVLDDPDDRSGGITHRRDEDPVAGSRITARASTRRASAASV
jgi:hypothetical protein